MITCLRCEGERTIQIHQSAAGKRIDWLETQAPDPANIISGRERLDGQWGWQCACGNNTLLTSQEARTFTNPVAPTPQEIGEIVNDLKAEPNTFVMVAA